MNGGKMLMRAVGMAGKREAGKHSLLNKHCRQTQPADSPPGTGLKTNGPQLAGLAAITTAADDLACLSPCSAGRWGECSGVGTQEGGCRPT